jgi:ABC-type polysaccharide/polyol phosphate export permease
MFSSLVLSSMFAVSEKSSKAHFRNSITPTDELAFLAASYAANIIVVALQLVIFVAVSVVFLGLGFVGVGKLIALLLVGASFFILLGMLIGELFVSQEGSIIASLSIGSLLLFFSNTIIPLESLPWLAREIANYNPFVLIDSLLRKTLIHLIPFGQLANELFILVVYCAALFALLIIVAKFERIKALKGDSKPVGKEPAHQGAAG